MYVESCMGHLAIADKASAVGPHSLVGTIPHQLGQVDAGRVFAIRFSSTILRWLIENPGGRRSRRHHLYQMLGVSTPSQSKLGTPYQKCQLRRMRLTFCQALSDRRCRQNIFSQTEMLLALAWYRHVRRSFVHVRTNYPRNSKNLEPFL